MTLPDLINGCFEAGGGVYSFKNVYKLYRSKQVRGVAIDSAVWWTAWGVFNLYYYPHLSQPLSFTGGIIVVLANAIWVTLAWRYRKN